MDNFDRVFLVGHNEIFMLFIRILRMLFCVVDYFMYNTKFMEQTK